MARAFVSEGIAAKLPALDAHSSGTQVAHAAAAVLALLSSFLPKQVGEASDVLKNTATFIVDFVVDVLLKVLQPLRDVFGNVTANYVDYFAQEQGRQRIGGPGNPSPGLQGAAAAAFDGILRPLGFMGGNTDPSQRGSGEAAAQWVLGCLINLHLNTWVVNEVQDVVGLGILKLFTAFDDVILSAMNTRSMGRLAFRPYMQTFMVDPAVRDLNIKWPLKDPGPGTIVKAYTQGHISYTEFLDKMREKGYASEVAATYITDVQKHPSHSDVAWLVNTGVWTEQQGQAQLEADGIDSSISQAVLLRAMFAGSEALARSIADEVVDEYAHFVIDREAAQQIIIALGFPKFEQDLYIQLMELKHHRPIRPPYAQVKALYQASMVDLEYVTNWLEAEHYTPDDARAIILMDFATAVTRSAHEAQLGAMYRLRSVTYEQKAAADLAKANQAKADAESRLASKYAGLAARYGG
jgi:hypothetical protein